MDSYAGLKFEESGLSEVNPVKFFIRTFKTEKVIRMHYHNSFEINLCRGVGGSIRCESGVQDLTDDCLLIIPPEVPHSYILPQSEGSIDVYHFKIDALPGSEAVTRMFSELVCLKLTQCPPSVFGYLEDCRGSLAGPLKCAGSLLLLTDCIVSIIRPAEAGAVAGSFLRKVIDFTEKHYHERISLDDISSCVGMSRYHFSRKFKERSGETWSAYLLGVRLSKAQRMIETGASVAETAESCGFESDSYFIKCFKQAFGITPLAWTKAVISKNV